MRNKRKSINEILDLTQKKISRLTPEEAHSAQKKGALIIDTRDSADQLTEGIIPEAKLITRNTLEWRCDPEAELPDPLLSKLDKKIIIMCNDGYSSSLAVKSLMDIGRTDVSDIIGGYRAWKNYGLPTSNITTLKDRKPST
ncbi:MAG: sulfurtransferase [Chloroflexi bacterium]|nr:sulfurtransferase [Chloroflexota bacterium]|tara:strand:- start:139 stop:561 length:423 start_codon:yes stop_codon:yes gene_type:complete